MQIERAILPRAQGESMSERTRDLLVHGIAAVKGQSKTEARHYLQWVLDAPDAAPEEIVEAWRGLADVSDDPKEKRNCLEQVLAYNPADPEARRELALLDGRLKPEEIVDPDRLPASAPSTAAPPRRYVCTQCGGAMAFTPEGNALACEYCGQRQWLGDLSENNALLVEQNLIAALATVKGHSKPAAMRAVKCQGCGASFVLAPQTLSANCAYCGSAYVAEQIETRELIEPEGVVPFALTRDQATRALLGWFRAEKLSLRGDPVPPIGVYLPVWTFDLVGEIGWTCLQEQNDLWLPASGNRVVYENDLCVAASHTLSATLIAEINSFPLDALVPYDARYLVDWAAETYTIAVSDASLVARWRVLERERKIILGLILNPYKDLQMSAARLVIESYKLILVPAWIAHYRREGKQYAITINGRTGKLRAEKPTPGVRKFLANLLGNG
jgi:DNA-directed RNA polymerase subunit RPC12/RpoP